MVTATQQALWHDSLEDSLRDVVTALGGPKAVAHMLWPAKTLQDGARLLNHCLDSERPEKLGLAEVVLLLTKGREADCHTAMHFLADAAGYETPKPINPETERERVQREFIRAQAQMQELVKRMERLS